MKTLYEHNKEKEEIAAWLDLQNKAGVLCNSCKTEMVYENKTSVLGEGQHVRCPNCKAAGLKRD